MSTGAARALLLAAVLASVGPSAQGLCAMPGGQRPHACCDGGGDRVEPSCCHARPAQPLARVAAPLPAPAAMPADVPCAAVRPAAPSVPGADRHWSHSPPLSVLRI